MTQALTLPRPTRLTRTRRRRVLAGVCTGLARFTGINRWVYRMVFLCSLPMTGGLSLLLYLAAAFVMPEDIEPVPALDVRRRTLERSRTDRLLGGVCAGIAGRFDLDPTVVRLLWVLATFGSLGLGLIVYTLMVMFVPKAGDSR